MDKNPTSGYRHELNKLVEYGYQTKVFTKKEKRYLTPSFSRIPTIYTFAKIHKDPVNPPARPIFNSIESVTARVGQYLDRFGK